MTTLCHVSLTYVLVGVGVGVLGAMMVTSWLVSRAMDLATQHMPRP